MPRFDRYLLSQLLVLFGFFALVLVLIYWVNRAVILFDQLIANGHSAMVFLEFSILSLPNVIRMTLPIAAFVASVYVANRLASDSELVVMQTTGHSPFRLARPVLVFGLIVGLMMLVLTHLLVPASAAELKLRQAEIAQSATARLLREGRFLHPARGLTFYVAEIDPDGRLSNIFLSDSRERGRRIAYSARSALLVQDGTGTRLVMLDGMAQVLNSADKTLATTSFDDFVLDIGTLLESGRVPPRTPWEMSTRDLLWPDAAIRAGPGYDRAVFLQTAHERFSQALISVGVSLIGFAAILMGGFSRFSLWKQVLLAVALLIALKSLDNVMVARARADDTAWPLIYLAPLLGLGLSGLMLWMADRPALRSAAWRRGRAAG